MSDDQLAALYQEQEQEVEEAIKRVENGMATETDAALFRWAFNHRQPRPIPNINAADQPF